MLLSWLKREIRAPIPQFQIPVVVDRSYCDKLSARKLHMAVCQCTWLCANKCIQIDLYKVNKVIFQQPAAFI